VRSVGPIWLVRHASTAWTGLHWCGRSDPPLTPAGVVAASRLAIELAHEIAAGAVVITSPLLRAVQTADAIAAVLGAMVRVDPDLVEIDFGDADGLTWEELAAGHPMLADEILAGGEPDWPGGESVADVDRRARSVAARLGNAARQVPLVVVSHGGLLRAVARELGAAEALRLEPAAALRIEPVVAALP
jgi:probable phosphoglycerate mutase